MRIPSTCIDFLDTSGWFAALSPKEAQHCAALATYRRWIGDGVTLVTTNLVVAEIQILLSRFRDQRLSQTDDVSFEVMRTRRIRSALSLDKHFALARFELAP